MQKDSYQKTLDYLKKKNKILFLTTSNRWKDSPTKEKAKSTKLAYKMAEELGDKVTLLEIPLLNIFPCHGNVSTDHGNVCGLKDAAVQDKEKNPDGNLRCWVAFSNKDDELWKVTKELFQADTVVFFGSIRWGQMNGFYQKLIERLTWLENRHTTLGEDNILEGKDVGIIAVGQNWNGENVIQTQKKVLEFFGFNVVDDLCWNWQFSTDENDESQESYKQAIKTFQDLFLSKK